MAHIGIDSRLTYYRVGGISTYITALIEALRKVDTPHQFTIAKSRKAHLNNTAKFKEVGLWTPPHHRLERIALSAELVRFGLDIYHATDFIPPYFGAKRQIITVHDLTFLHYPQHKDRAAQSYYNDQINYAVNHSDHILAVSEATKNDLMTMLNVPEHKITVQPHGVDPRFRPLPDAVVQSTCTRLGVPQNSILHVGTLEPRKNIPTLLDAYRLLPKETRAEHPLVLVGHIGWLFDDTMKCIQALQAQGEPIVVLNDILDDDLPAIYNFAKLFVLPSFYEGFGLPALEAMACGIPVIVSSTSSMPEVVGDVGLQINPTSSDDLHSKIDFALNDTVWSERASESGIKRAATFTWERSAKIALSVYTALSQ